MQEKIKKLFALSVKGEPETLTSEQLKNQINNNLTIMNWMWLILLITLSGVIIVKDNSIQIFCGIASVFILSFISSLHNSQKQNMIILEIRSLKENVHFVMEGK